MTPASWPSWLLRTSNGMVRALRGRRPAARHCRPGVEAMEDRLTPVVTSVVAGGILTINGTFNDTVVVTASGGLVRVNGADPNSGAALASTISQINVNPGPGNNVVDLRNVLLGDYTNLINFTVNGGAGQDTYKVNPSFPGTLASGNQANTLIFEGAATNVTTNLITNTVGIDGRTINIPGNSARLRLDLNMTSFTLNPGPGTHPILADDPTANDGISRAFNARPGSFLDFKNPTGTLTVRDLNAVNNGSIYEFQGLDLLGRPSSVVLDANNRADTIRFGGTVGNIVADLVNDVVHLDNMNVAIPNSGPASLQFMANMVDFTLRPSAGNHRILQDNGTASDGISRALDNGDTSFIDFRNPTGSLTVQETNGAGGSTYEFRALDSVGRPARVALDSAGRAGTQVIAVPGTVNTVVTDLADERVLVDSQAIEVLGLGPANLFLDMDMDDLVIRPGAGSHLTLQDDAGANNGISRALNADGSFTDFGNPSDSLTVQNVTGTGDSIYEFQARDVMNPPAVIVLDVGASGGELRFRGTFADVIADLVNRTVSLSGLAIGLAGSGAATLRIEVNMVNFTLRSGAGSHVILVDDPTASDGISRALADGAAVDFRNPTTALTTADTSAAGGSLYEFRGLDAATPPGTVTLLGADHDKFVVRPSAVTQVFVNTGLPNLVGNALTLEPAGAAGTAFTPQGIGAGTFTFANRQAVTFQGIEDALLGDGAVLQNGAVPVPAVAQAEAAQTSTAQAVALRQAVAALQARLQRAASLERRFAFDAAQRVRRAARLAFRRVLMQLGL